MLQAMGAGVIAPVAVIAAALAVGISGGGLSGLGSLGQALTGPQIPDAELIAANNRASRDRVDPGDLLALAGDAATLAATAPAAGRPRSGSDRERRRPTDSDPGTPTRPVTPTQPGPQVTPVPQPTVTPPPQPTPTPSTVRQVGDQVKEVTDPVPVAGGPVGQVIDIVVDTVDGILP